MSVDFKPIFIIGKPGQRCPDGYYVWHDNPDPRIAVFRRLNK